MAISGWRRSPAGNRGGLSRLGPGGSPQDRRGQGRQDAAGGEDAADGFSFLVAQWLRSEAFSGTERFAAGELCPFAVQLVEAGKDKLLSLSNDRVRYVAPGTQVIVTNLEDPPKQVTLHVSGPVHLKLAPNGEFLISLVLTGSNILIAPKSSPANQDIRPRLAYFQGRFTLTLEALQPVGEGTVTDICTLID